MRTAILAVAVLVLAACNCERSDDVKTAKSAPTKQEYLESLDSAMSSYSIVFWTADTAYNANPELMTLLDTLYLHGFSWSAATSEADVRKDEAWTAAYRKRLCAYYDRHMVVRYDTLSEYAKADSVLNEGLRLIALGNGYSTPEMVATNGMMYRFNQCREYGQLSQLLNACEDTTVSLLVLREFASCVRLRDVAEEIMANIVGMTYWGGSATGPATSACFLSMQEARMKAYQNMVDYVLDVGYLHKTGVYYASAKKLYEDCVSTTLTELSKDEQIYYSDCYPELYDEVMKETAQKLRQILPMIDEWSKLVAQLDNEFNPYFAHEIECNATSMLISFAEEATSPIR